MFSIRRHGTISSAKGGRQYHPCANHERYRSVMGPVRFVMDRTPVRWRSVPYSTNASVPSPTPAHLADGASGHAHTAHHCPTQATTESDLRDDAVRLRNRRWRHCLRRCCDRKGKARNSDQPDHSSYSLTCTCTGSRLDFVFRIVLIANIGMIYIKASDGRACGGAPRVRLAGGPRKRKYSRRLEFI